VRAQRSELAERHSAPECSAASPETEWESAALRRAGSAAPKVLVLRPLAVRAAGQLESAAQLQAGSAMPKVLVLCPLAVRAAGQLESAAQLQAGWATPEAIAWCPAVAAVREMACSFAAAAPKAQCLARPGASAGQASALPPGEPAASDAVVVPQQEAAALAGAAVRRPEAAARDGAEVVARRQEVEARDAAGVLPREVLPSAARPLAVPFFPRGQLRRPARPAPRPAARVARAMECFRIASP
jgi:hypothetical protein